LYRRCLTSRQAAFGGQSNGRHFFVIFDLFVPSWLTTPFVSVPSFLL
jgi:hypothetical protein